MITIITVLTTSATINVIAINTLITIGVMGLGLRDDAAPTVSRGPASTVIITSFAPDLHNPDNKKKQRKLNLRACQKTNNMWA